MASIYHSCVSLFSCVFSRCPVLLLARYHTPELVAIVLYHYSIENQSNEYLKSVVLLSMMVENSLYYYELQDATVRRVLSDNYV